MDKYNECYEVLEKFDGGNHSYFSQVKALEISKEKAYESKDLKAMARITKDQLKLVNKFKGTLYGKFKKNISYATEYDSFKYYCEKYNYYISAYQYKSLVMSYELYGFEKGYSNYTKLMKSYNYSAISYKEYNEFYTYYSKFQYSEKYNYYKEASKLNNYSAIEYKDFEKVLDAYYYYGHYELKSKEYYNYYKSNFCLHLV